MLTEVFAFCSDGRSTSAKPAEALQMLTGVQEEIPYCSPGTSSGKQKKAHSTVLQ